MLAIPRPRAARTGNLMPGDEFELWDLRAGVTGNKQDMVCNHTPGDYFELSGENLSFPTGRPFSIYALAATLPQDVSQDAPQGADD